MPLLYGYETTETLPGETGNEAHAPLKWIVPHRSNRDRRRAGSRPNRRLRHDPRPDPTPFFSPQRSNLTGNFYEKSRLVNSSHRDLRHGFVLHHDRQ